MSFSVSGKTAIVTGAANGVGLAIGRHLLDQGANVMFVDMDEEKLAHEIGEVAEEKEEAQIFAGDLRKNLTIKNLLSATVDVFEGIDILVNGSRQVLPTDPLDPEDTSVADLLEQNLMTALRLSQATARRMIKLSDPDGEEPIGSIVNLSSIAAQRAHCDLMGFSISTAALNQMTSSLAVALAPKRIRVNAVALGSVMSSSLKHRLREDEELRDPIIRSTPLGRIGAPGVVSNAVQYLASDASSFVTGQIITVDGGRTLLDAAAVPAH